MHQDVRAAASHHSPPFQYTVRPPDDSSSEPVSSPGPTPPSSRQASRTPSPFERLPSSREARREAEHSNPAEEEDDVGFADWNDGGTDDEAPPDADMPSDLRPPFHRPTDGRSHTPLLASKGSRSPSRPRLPTRRSTLHERDPDPAAQSATRRRYTYAAAFLLLSLVSFAVQTETAVYIQHHLHWDKAYCML